MKNVFLDSNIWLSLYHFTGDDLEQFSKLGELNGTVFRILIPEQIHDEVKRNRDSKLKDALKSFEKLDFSFPTFCKSYDEYAEFYDQFNDLKKRHREWCAKIQEDIATQSLQADKVIQDFFESCPCLPCTDEIVRMAELRYKKGNPPGKDNKFGDAINWECLLANSPAGEDLYFISSDKDYKSVVDDQRLNLFLMDEWNTKKNSSIHFYVNLVAFFKANVHEIELETEQKKEDLINSLQHSRNFATTHAIIAELDKLSDWSSEQIDSICSAAMNNSQVAWIIGDDDVLNFYKKLLSSVQESSEYTSGVWSQIAALNQETVEDAGELPF